MSMKGSDYLNNLYLRLIMGSGSVEEDQALIKKCSMKKDAKIIWGKCLDIIRDNVDENIYETWFRPLVPLDVQNNCLRILVPSPFYTEWLDEHFADLLAKVLYRIMGKNARLEYVIRVINNGSEQGKTMTTPANLDTASLSSPSSKTLPPEVPPISPYAAIGISSKPYHHGLNPRYTFANFVEGDFNRLAILIGKSLAQTFHDRSSYTPLFLYGPTGVGKSHLLQAIGNEALKYHPKKIILYRTAEDFTNEFIKSVNKKKKTSQESFSSYEDFVSYYSKVDMLLLDDVQFLSNKEKTINAFFYLFNYLQQNNKIIVLSSDVSPQELRDIPERVLSRFRGGTQVEITYPSFEDRKAILQFYLSQNGIDLESSLIEFIAHEGGWNVRDLIGFINNLLVRAIYEKSKISLPLIQEVMSKFQVRRKREVSLDFIVQVVCEYYGITREQILSRSKKQEVAIPRQIAMYLATKYTKRTMASIGKYFGKRDHTTVVYAKKTISQQIEIDRKKKHIAKDIEEIEKRLHEIG